MDEIGFVVKYINENGFLYFDTIGGHDKSLIAGRRVSIVTKKGNITGVIGKKAIHLMSSEERKKVSELSEMWIDIGVNSKTEAKNIVSIGDPVVYKHNFEVLRNSIGVARAFDNKAGCYVVCETIRRLSKIKHLLEAQVVGVATTQEEIGTRGAITSSYTINPDVAIAIDVSHATDYPDCDKRKLGEFFLGKGPIICRGPNINQWVYENLIICAKNSKIPYQIEACPGITSTDARSIQVTRKGVATGLISIPLRYMHTPSELINLEDLEQSIKLLMAFSKFLTKKHIKN